MRVAATKKTEAKVFDLSPPSPSTTLIEADKNLIHILQEPWKEKVEGFLISRQASRSLDLGCGHGSWSRKLQSLGYQVTGIDISLRRIRTAIETTPSEDGEDIFFLVGDGENLPFCDGYFDTVFCGSILHHFGNLPAAMVEIRRVLRKGGSVVLSEPGLLNPFAFVRRRYFPSATHTPSERPFVPSRLRKQVELYFRNVKCEHFYLISCVLPFVTRFIGKSLARMLLFPFYRFDRFLLSHFPVIQQFSWVIVMTADKP